MTVRHILCGLTNHEFTMSFTGSRLALECSNCGYLTTGVQCGPGGREGNVHTFTDQPIISCWVPPTPI